MRSMYTMSKLPIHFLFPDVLRMGLCITEEIARLLYLCCPDAE